MVTGPVLFYSPNCRFRHLMLYSSEVLHLHGRVAQLGERGVRNAEVEGSNPFASTRRTVVGYRLQVISWLSRPADGFAL